MALNFLVLDGFDHYPAVSDLGTAGAWSGASLGSVTLVTGASARLSYGKAVQRGTSGSHLTRSIPTLTEMQVGFGAYADDFLSSGNPGRWLTVSRTSAGGLEVGSTDFVTDVAGRMHARVDGTIVASANLTLGGSRFHYCEFYLKYGGAGVGRIMMWLDGNLVMDYTGNTIGTTGSPVTSTWDFLKLFNAGATNARIDDFYLAIPSAGPEPVRDCRILTYYPTLINDSTGWTANTTTVLGDISDLNNATLASTTTDATFIDFEVDNIDDVTPETIYAVALGWLGSKDGASPRGITPAVTPDLGALASGTTRYHAAGSTTYFQEVWSNNPNTTAEWDIDELTAAAFRLTMTTS